MLQISGEAVIRLQLPIERRQQFWIGIQDLITLPADQVDVGAMLVGGVDHPPFPKVDAGCETLLDQEIQGAVDGGDVHRMGSFLDDGEYFISVDVIALVGDGFYDHLALGVMR